jgi:hypothetical protein
MANVFDYDNAADFFGVDDAARLTAEVTSRDGKSYLLVTEVGEEDGGQFLFEIDGNRLTFIAGDTVVDLEAALSPGGLETSEILESAVSCIASSATDHRTVHEAARNAVGNFSTRDGPDGGNLACVWSVRRLAKRALGRTITETDLTTTFDVELRRCFGDDKAASVVPPGGIIIAPTAFSAGHRLGTGHVGILGEGSGDTRLVYSNSSGRKMWSQNFTVGSFTAHYRSKGLKTFFFPLPLHDFPGGIV